MIKAVFFDVDGTLLSHTKKAVSKSTKTALDLLAKKGIKRILATGRHTLELDQLPIRDIPFDGYILLNGHLCLNAHGQIVSGTPIEGADKQTILRLFQEKTMPLVLVEKDRMYINFINEHVELAQQAISTPIPCEGTYTGNNLYQAVAYLEKGKEGVLARLLPGCKATRWSNFGLDVFSASGGKTVGIKHYLEANHILPEETMAFGDGENDIGMLEFVGVGVAMGNADDRIKERADYVTASVDDDGILKALTALKIIDQP